MALSNPCTLELTTEGFWFKEIVRGWENIIEVARPMWDTGGISKPVSAHSGTTPLEMTPKGFGR